MSVTCSCAPGTTTQPPLEPLGAAGLPHLVVLLLPPPAEGAYGPHVPSLSGRNVTKPTVL